MTAGAAAGATAAGCADADLEAGVDEPFMKKTGTAIASSRQTEAAAMIGTLFLWAKKAAKMDPAEAGGFLAAAGFSIGDLNTTGFSASPLGAAATE